MRVYSNVNVVDKTHNNRVFARNNDSFYVEVDPLDKNNYSVSAENINVGSLIAVLIQSKAAVVTRQGEHLKNNKRYSFFYVFKGEMVVSNHQGTSRMRENNFILLDNMRDRTMFVSNYVSFIIISVNATEMSQYLPRPDEVVGQLQTYSGNKQAFFFGSLLTFWDQIKHNMLSQEFTHSLANELLRNIAANYASCYRNIGVKQSSRVQQIRNIIGENLSNPDLSVEMIAARMKVSARYLRSIFSKEEKLSRYILRRRLEECALQLENPLFSSLSISSIAFNMGFNSNAHFSRAFKQKFGMSPRDYRKRHIGTQQEQE